MESICPICKKPYDGVVCTQCTVTDLDVSGLMASEGLHVETIEKEDDGATAFLVDLVSNRKIPITTPRCKVGRDDLNDIVISGDQSISRFHFVITKENNQYLVQDGKSRHGTFLNGNQITVPEPIHDGDVLKVGVSLFWFVIENVVAGAEPDKTSPVAMEHDEAELEFGAPEPTPQPQRYISASATQTNLPRADLSETGAFPALDLSGDLLHSSQDEIQLNRHDELMQSYKSSAESAVQQFSPGPDVPEVTHLLGEVSAESAPEPAKEPAKGSSEEAEDSEPHHSYRSAHDTAKVINSHGSDENRDFGNLSFFEPLNDVVNELGTDALHVKDEAAGKSAEPVAEASHEAESAAHEEPVSAQDSESLGHSTFDADTAAYSSFEPAHNNFENLFDALPPSDLVSPAAEHETQADASEATENAEAAEQNESPEASESETEDVHSSEPSEPINSEANESPESPTPESSTESSEASGTGGSEAEPAMASSNELSTLGRLAEIVEEAGSPTAPIQGKDDTLLSQMISAAYTNQLEEPTAQDDHENGASETKHTSNGAKSLMSTTKESLSGTVPDWCNRYFHGELSRLGKELTDLNDQVRAAQQKIKEVEGRVSLTKGLRNTLLTSTGEELVEGCGRVLSLLGWRIKISEDDKHELRVETDEKHTCIARVVWTETQADRTHLGQLSISQTRYWCEQGIEPKGILIVSRTGDNGPQALTASDMNSELADYASKKNVCLMTTLQLLAIFKDIALHDGSMDTARATIMASNGWLPGFNLEPADEKEEGSSNKLSSLLSA